MKKDAYYFSHDSNARNDEKVLAIRMKHGMEGYGIFFAIIERLRESTNYMSIKDYNIIAFDLRVSAVKIKSVVEDFGLFEFTDDSKFFYSESLSKRMDIKNVKSEKARRAAEKRWGKRNNKAPDKQEVNANALQTQSEPNALKESKVKESKEKRDKNTHARAFYFLEKNYPSRLETEFFMKHRNKIKDFKKFIQSFNNKVDIEELKYTDRILFARLSNFANNWIDFDKKQEEKQPQKVKRPKYFK